MPEDPQKRIKELEKQLKDWSSKFADALNEAMKKVHTRLEEIEKKIGIKKSKPTFLFSALVGELTFLSRNFDNRLLPGLFFCYYFPQKFSVDNAKGLWPT